MPKTTVLQQKYKNGRRRLISYSYTCHLARFRVAERLKHPGGDKYFG